VITTCAKGKPIVKLRILKILKHLLFAVLVIVGVNYWQTKDLPVGLAPAGMVQGIDGANVSLQETGRQSLIYFFAPWCGVCRMSMPNLNHVQRFFPGLTVIAVALDFANPRDVQIFAKEVNLTVTAALGDDHLREQWRISAYPTYVVVDEEGKVAVSSVGYSTLVGMLVRVLWTRLGF
jgi:thiol-disulfide isomerase/thioredoxin